MGPHRYYEDDGPSFCRDNTRGHGYPLSHDRDLPPAPLHISYETRRALNSNHDIRVPENHSDQDTNARPRSRIPVACGRCRKRKIRCSGDNGGPCTNCKSAGHEQCQFLRVASQEAPLKIDSSVPEFFDSGATASRLQCRMATQTPHQYMTTHSPPPVNYDTYQYRSSSLSTYQQYPGKQYYSGVSPFADYDEHVDYGLQASPYQLMSPNHIQPTSPSSNYGSAGPIRGWTPTPQLPKSSNLFTDQEAQLYSHGQLPYNHGGSFPLRTTVGPDPKSLGLSGMPTLPTPVSGNDRVLPNPIANRIGQIGTFLRNNNDGLMPMNQITYQPYNYMNANMLNTVKSSSHSVSSDNGYSIPVSSNSPESIASSQIYPGSENSGSLSQHHHDIYSPSDDLHYHTSEPPESSYGHSSSSRRESHSSRTTHNEGSLPSLPEGDLSNGQHYVPYHNSAANYPTPPMNIPPPASIHPRSPIQSVH